MPRKNLYPESRGREIVYNRAQGRCEACGSNNGSDWAHRKARSQMGGWEPSNGLLLCRSCHSWCHANPTLARERGLIVKGSRDPLEVPARLMTLFGPRYCLLDNFGGIMHNLPTLNPSDKDQ